MNVDRRLSPVANTDRSIAFLDERHVDLAPPPPPRRPHTPTGAPAAGTRGPPPAEGGAAVPSGSVVYRPFTWDAIKSGSMNLPGIADRVVADIWRRRLACGCTRYETLVWCFAGCTDDRGGLSFSHCRVRAVTHACVCVWVGVIGTVATRRNHHLL